MKGVIIEKRSKKSMRKILRGILFIVLINVMLIDVAHVYAAKNSSPLSGWVKKGTKKYYYKNNQKVTGWKRIKNKKYYFNKKGQLQTNRMIEKNKYVNKKGVLVSKKDIYKNSKKGLQSLEKKLRKMVGGYGGTYSIYVKNLDTNKYCMINNQSIYPASLIKLYNMGCIYEYLEKNKINKTPQITGWINSMITVSSNDAYNLLLAAIGGGSVLTGVDRVNKFCEKQGYLQTASGGTLSPTYLKPQHKGSSSTSVKDCGHILEDIYRGTLVSEKASKEMLAVLTKQERRSKIPAGLPNGVKCANKTGEVGAYQHDAAIVFSKKADYIIVIMSNNNGASIYHIRSLSTMVYQHFN